MKTVSPNVQYLIDQVSQMDQHELKEFRIMLVKNLGMEFLQDPTDDDGDTPAGAGVPLNPKTPNLSGNVTLG